MMHCYRAAICLNNTGVELLRRRCIDKAMQCFRNAITIMKDLTSQTEPCSRDAGPLEIPSCTLERIQAWLHDGEQELASPFQPSASASLANNIVLNVISDGENLSAVLAGLPNSRRVDTSHIKFVVRIEPVEVNESSLMQEQSFHSATMLYNYGMAYTYLSNLETSRPFADILRERAEHLFLLASSILSNEALSGSRTIDGALISPSPVFSRAILVSVMTLQQLLGLASSQRKEDDYFYFCEIIESLLPTLKILVAIEDHSVQVVAGAA